eukprot:27497-Pelagococcus_subviridis.AAC.1
MLMNQSSSRGVKSQNARRKIPSPSDPSPATIASIHAGVAVSASGNSGSFSRSLGRMTFLP